MEKLNRQLIASGFRVPDNVHAQVTPADLPIRVLQFGEGNFLRGFVDWMIHRLNTSGRFGGGVLVVQPIAQGLAGRLNEQDGLYTLLLRGVHEGRTVDHRELVSSVIRGLNPYEQFDEYLAAARLPTLRFVVSNTTEAGIVFRPEDRLEDRPPASFPGKLTRLLWERYSACGGPRAAGLAIVPCELIERNGDVLREAVMRTAANWNLPAEFVEWLRSANEFANTLVDRIVTGYPRDDAAAIQAELGYEDGLLVAGEPFHLWVIEASPAVAREWPFHEVGLNVVYTDNLKPYRDRKVRILNGAHTMTALAAYLMGLETVGQCMADERVRSFMHRGLHEEIIPTLDLPSEDLESFASAVVERFGNPHVRHELYSITLNSTSKFKARLVPSIVEYARRRGGAVPARLTFAMAALIAFYRGGDGATGRAYTVQDEPTAVAFFREAWRGCDGSPEGVLRLVRQVLANESLWGAELPATPGVDTAVAGHLGRILRDGVGPAMVAADG